MNLAQENFRLLWAGEWPLWQTIGTALLLIAIAAWLYLGEAKRGTNGRLRWVLPTLRCLALVAIVLTLAGPVLQFQTEEGNRGKITVFLDERRVFIARQLICRPQVSSCPVFRERDPG